MKHNQPLGSKMRPELQMCIVKECISYLRLQSLLKALTNRCRSLALPKCNFHAHSDYNDPYSNPSFKLLPSENSFTKPDS